MAEEEEEEDSDAEEEEEDSDDELPDAEDADGKWELASKAGFHTKGHEDTDDDGDDCGGCCCRSACCMECSSISMMSTRTEGRNTQCVVRYNKERAVSCRWSYGDSGWPRSFRL